jgi:hypothetical protein
MCALAYYIEMTLEKGADVPLHQLLTSELSELHDRYVRSGELLPADKLAECYRTFRERFGPGALSRLDAAAR